MATEQRRQPRAKATVAARAQAPPTVTHHHQPHRHPSQQLAEPQKLYVVELSYIEVRMCRTQLYHTEHGWTMRLQHRVRHLHGEHNTTTTPPLQRRRLVTDPDFGGGKNHYRPRVATRDATNRRGTNSHQGTRSSRQTISEEMVGK
jgi:hypothetical protein